MKNIQKLINKICSIDEVLSKSELKQILPNLSFGIEIEMKHKFLDYASFESSLVHKEFHPMTDKEDIKNWKKLIQLTYSNAKTAWNVHRDGSLGENGTEFVSPPMPYTDFLQKIPEVVKILKDLGFFGNSQTGLHIGVSSDEINLSEAVKDTFEYYEKKYSPFVATVLAYNIDSKGLFAQGDVERQEAKYSKDLAGFIEVFEENLNSYLSLEGRDTVNLDDVLYHSHKFIRGDRQFRRLVDNNEHEVSMTRRADYVGLED
jgi:hypothetical protein